MAAVANMKTAVLAVEPGQTVTTEVSLVNTGTIVEQFTVLLLGDVAAWAEVTPPVVSLFPQGSQTVTVRFSPPRHHLTPSGPVEFGVKIIPSNEPEESVVEEGVITVGSFNDVGAELVPRVSTGRLSGKQKLAVDSRGNVPVPVELAAFDAADGLKFNIRPSQVVAAPGEARFARVKVKPRQRFWKGPAQQKPYKVQVTPAGEKPLVLDGSLTQKAVLPKWLLPLIALLALLVLFWFFVLRPIVKSTAVTANAAALAAQAADTKRLNAQLAETKATVAALAAVSPPTTAKSGAGSMTPTATTVPSIVVNVPGAATTTTTTSTTVKATTATTAPPPIVGPVDGRIEVVAQSNAAPVSRFFVPVLGAGSELAITDLIIQNQVPGTSGTVTVQRATPNATPPVTESLLVNPFTTGTLTDEQYHFNTPILIRAGQRLQVSLACTSATDQESNAGIPLPCDVGVYYDGSLTQPGGVPTTTTSIPGP